MEITSLDYGFQGKTKLTNKKNWASMLKLPWHSYQLNIHGVLINKKFFDFCDDLL